jgi:hypothetical protein
MVYVPLPIFTIIQIHDPLMTTLPELNTKSQTPISQSTILHRLTVEAGKFNGLTSGDSLSISEIQKQMEANGYTESEIDQLLEANDLDGAAEIEIPPQEDLLGDSWDIEADNIGNIAENSDNSDVSWQNRPSTREDGYPAEPLDGSIKDCYGLYKQIARSVKMVDKKRYLSDDGTPLTASDAVSSYIKQRHGEKTTAKRHGWVKGRRYSAKQQYSKGMALDRQLLDQFENPTTVLLSLRMSPTVRSRLTLLTELGKSIGLTIDQLRYRLQNAPNAPLTAKEWAYFTVVAGTEKRATPHLHIMIYCADDVRRDRFIPVVEKFVENCKFAPNDMRGNSPESDVISVRGNDGNSIPRVNEESLNTNCEYKGRNSQGAVYALTQLPHLEAVDKMAQDELLHSSTVDAWDGNAFRKSRIEIEKEYLATNPV